MTSRLSIITAIIVLLVLGLSFAQSSPSAPAKPTEKPTKLPDGLEYWDVKPGIGAEASSGKTVTVHYTGWLKNGLKFESSHDRNKPFEFNLGAGNVIKGWDEGIPGMRVGGKRQLRIPPKLGYGAKGAGALIPPNSTLIFEVDLLEVKPETK